MMSRKTMAGIAVGILVPVLTFFLIRTAIRAHQSIPMDEIDSTLVETYCRLVAEERYQEAYEQCLSKSYQDEVSAEDFAGAHAKNREERGILNARELLKYNPSQNLFSGIRELQVLYKLAYPSREHRDYMIITNADGDWRIDGTYLMGVNSLDFKVW